MNETLVLVVRVAVSLALVLGLLWFLSRRLGQGRTATRRLPVTVLGRQSLGRRSGVTVVDVAGRTLVLGVTDTEVRLLTELDSGPFQLADEGEAFDLDENHPDASSPTGEGQVPEPIAPHAPGSGLPGSMQTTSALGGSVLSPQTWQATWTALRARMGR